MASTEDPADAVTPYHVLLWGGSSLTAGMLVAAAASYYKSRKSLLKEGFDPTAQARVMPMALKALAASTLLTGCIGVGGFYLLKSYGFFKRESVPVPDSDEAWRMVKDPKAFWRSLSEENKSELTSQQTSSQQAASPRQ